MSIDLLELAAADLGDLTADVVFVGGATLVLWITDPGAPPLRPTKDVDAIVEVTTPSAYHDFEERLRARRFAEDQVDGVICRWRHRDSGLVLDAMPADARILGFDNRWQSAALPHAIERSLPSGALIRAVSPPYLLATKLEAFRSRGAGDFFGSRDFGDIVVLVDGREEIIDEVRGADSELRTYLADSVEELSAADRFADGVFAALLPDAEQPASCRNGTIPKRTSDPQVVDPNPTGGAHEAPGNRRYKQPARCSREDLAGSWAHVRRVRGAVRIDVGLRRRICPRPSSSHRRDDVSEHRRRPAANSRRLRGRGDRGGGPQYAASGGWSWGSG